MLDLKKVRDVFSGQDSDDGPRIGTYDMGVEIRHHTWVAERMQRLRAAAEASGYPNAFYISLTILVMEFIGERTIHPRGLGYETFADFIRSPWREYVGSKVEKDRLLILLHQELTNCVAGPIEAMWLGEVIAGSAAS